MAFSVTRAPVYGGISLAIEFTDGRNLIKEARYYLVYEGSVQRHVTTARSVSENELHSVVPGHSQEEQVQLSVICFHGDQQTLLVTSPFHFHNDGAFYLAQYLIDSVYNSVSLDDLELIRSDQFDLADEDLSTLDQRLSRALAHSEFPEFWSILGSDEGKEDPEPRETLLHFTAQLGLLKTAVSFLRKPGCQGALRLANKNGDLPKDVAIAKNHYKLIDLFSDLSAHGLFPLDQWFETDKGVVQMRDTGDVTLTSNVPTHQRTIEEDIIVLQGVQKQLAAKSSDPSKLWQATWPEQAINATEDIIEPAESSEEKLQTICDKVKDIPNIVSAGNGSSDTNVLDAEMDSNTNGRYASDDVDSSDDCDIVNETDMLPGQVASEDEEMNDILEGSISKLHGYTEKLMQIREKGNVFNRILEQDLRKENLARFSSSCPSLDIDCRNSPLPVIDETDHYRSMVDLAEDNEQNVDATATPSSHCSGELYSSGADIQNSTDDVHIIVEGATLGSSSDFGLQSQEYDQFLNEYYGGNIPQVRRRSYSPKVVKPVEPEEGSQFFSPSMLIHGSKSGNKLQSESEDTDDDRDPINSEDVSMSDSNLSADSHGYKPIVNSQEDVYMDNESSVNDEDSPSTKGSIRGPQNKARYSADIEYMVRQMKEHHSGSSLDKMTSSSERTSREEGAGLELQHGKITKALSTSSIPAATNAEKARGGGLKGLSQDSKHAQFHRQDEIEEEDLALMDDSSEIKRAAMSRITRKNKQLTLIDFLNEPSTFSNDMGPQSPKVKDKDKEEKKRKMNMFSRLHSYRIKKNKDKEGKNKSTHRFVSISFSNNTTCDLCHKPLTNKSALRCEVCLVNVHENSCKDQITPCDKFKPKSHPPRQSSAEGEAAVMGQDKNQPTGVVSNLRPTFSFKEKSTRPQSAFVGAATQPLPVQPEVQQESAVVIRKRRTALQSASAQLNRRSLPNPRILIDTSCLDDVPSRSPPRNLDKKKSRSPTRYRDSTKSRSPVRHSVKEKKGHNVFTSPNTGTYLQWRRASAVAVDRPIAEENEIESATRLDLGHSNITEVSSQSTESLDEVDGVQEVRFEDIELGNLMTEEPETWSETVDKKVLKKWNQKEVKRQDTIWELIQTERQYCKRLKTLQFFFRDGMLRDLGMSSAWVERMFPHLDDLIYIHLNFLRDLQDLQNKKPDRSVEFLGPALNKQFSGESAKQMKMAYGVFCTGHLEAVQLYKDFISKDRKFQAFIKQRMNLPICKKREIPDYILLITQRPTKYPTLIEAVIKSTKDKKDRESLGSALELSKQILQSVNEQVAAAERQMRLKEIYNRLDTRSFAIHRGKKFKKSDITANGRKLLYEGLCQYKNARGKTVEVLAVLLNDVFFFLQDNNQKYSFFAQDNKNGVVSLYSLLVREKRDTRDSKGMYIISQSKANPEMYEVIFNTTLEMQRWAQVIRAASNNCPAEEDEEDPSAEEERRQLEKKAKAQAIMDKLSAKDVEIKKCCDEKNKLMMDLIAVYNDTEDQHSRPNSRDFEESPVEDVASSRSSILQAALQEVSHAASQLTTMLQGTGTNLSRSVSSVGEHASHTFTAVPIPKRAETFAGFDTTHDTVRAKKKGPEADSEDFPDRTTVEGETHDISQSDLSQDTEIPPPIPQRMPFDNEADSDIGSSISSVSTLSPASAPYFSQEQSNIASLVRTLNSIVHLTAQQSTAVETLRCQLAEANERINKLSVDVHEKKGGYKHNQLEELRNLQGVIQKEKEELELKKERDTSYMESERSELEDMRKQLEKQEADIKQQKEELNKKRQVLQKQMDLLRQSGQLPNPDVADTNNDLQNDFVKGHRRSASAETFPAKNEPTSTGNVAVAPKESFRTEQRPSVTKLQSFSFGSSKQTLPEHLLSAKNEQKIGTKNVQQLPSKLLSGGLSETTPPRNPGSQSVSNSPDQGQIQGQGGANISMGGSHGNHSTPSFTQDSVGHGDTKTHMGHSSSVGVLSSHGNQHGSAVVISAGNRQSNRPKQQPGLAGLTGVMKLAEKGDKKSGKSTSSSHLGSDRGGSPDQRPKSGNPGQRNPNINHKPQKSDSEVIYF